MDLEAVPGVGAKTADALRELPDPERALHEGDVAAIARAPGIGQRRAARIARAAIRDGHGDPGGFAATERAAEIHREILDRLQDRAVTDEAAARLETLYPSPARSRIDEVRARTERALERDPDPEITEALADVRRLRDPGDVRVRDRCLATADAETYAQAQEAIPEVSVELVEDARQLGDLARGYSTVIVLDERFAGVDVDGDVRVEPDALESPETVVPERILDFFARNREPLLAAVAVARAADLETACDPDVLEAALARIDDDGTVVGDDELDRLGTAVDDLDAAVSMAESVANDRLREAIEAEDVTIDGTDLLSLVERGASVESLLSRELADEYDAAVAAARDHLVDALALSDTVDRARRAFPEEPTFPVEHDEGVLNRLREDLTAMRDRRAATRKREVAAELADLEAPARDLVDDVLALDVDLAIARFAADYDCTLPEIGGEGVSIEGGRSLLLDVPLAEVEPVDYEVEGVTLLSGVNSGGKTSTLDLVALVVTLAHMGLPVPADDARVGRFDELHYHAKTQGTLDAGAFEATLRDFGDLVTDVAADRGVLVLVDELESITEPGASAKIVAGILEALAERGATAVFVSHLAEDILEAAETDLRVDGIEATGLENGDLVVERSPVRGKLATSTPELIVEKLATDDGADGDGAAGDEAAGEGSTGEAAAADGSSANGATPDERAFYRSLLGKFEE